MQIKFIYNKELTFYGEQLSAFYFTSQVWVTVRSEIYVLCPKWSCAFHASLPQTVAFVILKAKKTWKCKLSDKVNDSII